MALKYGTGKQRVAVPIDKILDTEFEAFKIPNSDREVLRNKYEGHVRWLVNNVSTWLNDHKLSKSINKKGEDELFRYLSNIFYGTFGASSKHDTTLIAAIQDKNFNCYSSAILIADTLLRVGKDISIIVVDDPAHLLIRGSKFIFETTGQNSEMAISQIAVLDSRYGRYHEGEPTLLLSVVYTQTIGTLMKNGRMEEALRQCDRALDIDPESVSAWSSKGVLLHNLKKYEEALNSYDEAIRIFPEFSNAWYNKGSALFELGRFEDAIKCYDRAIEIDPKNSYAWNDKGETLFELNRLSEALECYDKSIGINPNNNTALENREHTIRIISRAKEIKRS